MPFFAQDWHPLVLNQHFPELNQLNISFTHLPTAKSTKTYRATAVDPNYSKLFREIAIKVSFLGWQQTGLLGFTFRAHRDILLLFQ